MSTSRERIIRKCNVRTDKYVILEAYPVPYLYSTFDSHPIADNYVILNKTVRTNVALVADHCFTQNDTELPDPCTSA